MAFDFIKKLLKKNEDLSLDLEEPSLDNSLPPQEHIQSPQQLPTTLPQPQQLHQYNFEQQPSINPVAFMPQQVPPYSNQNDLETIKQQIAVLSSKIDMLASKIDVLLQRIQMLEQFLYYRR